MTVSFWIFLDQICPKLLKLGQIGFLTNVTIIFDFLDQICQMFLPERVFWQ